MRIAFVTDTFHPMVDGITKAATALGEGLSSMGHEVRYWAVSPRREASYPGTTYYKGIPFPPYPDYALSLRSPRLEESILAFRPDVMHIHSPGGLGLQALGIAERHHIPCVFTYHTDLLAQAHYLPFSNLLSAAYRPLIKRAVRRFAKGSDAVLAPSAHAQELLSGMGVSCRVVPNAVDSDTFFRRAKDRTLFPALAGSRHDRTVLIVGRLIKEKRLERALHAAQELGPEASFVFVGTGPHERHLKAQARKEDLLGRNVFFCGRVDDETLARAYSNASLLFFPSDYDTFGLVAAEALSCGLPVVAPLGSAQMEIHRGAGMAGYKAGDEAGAIRDCLHKEGKIPAAAIRDVRKRYGKAGVAAMHLGIYEESVGNAARKSRTEAAA